MSYRFVIKGRLPGLNEFISSARGQPWWAAANKKKKAMKEVAGAIWQAKFPKFIVPVSLSIKFIEKDGRRDRDNVTSGGTKVILDALKHLGVIQNDSRKWVVDIQTDTKDIDKADPRVEVEITEVL